MAKKISSETSEPQSLRVLMVEDSEDDVLLTILALENGGYAPAYERVEDAAAMRKALREKTWDVILCDYQLPQFNGLAAIDLLKETGIDIPLIIVSGAIGEETAVECMRLGACDYIMKSNLSRLVPAIERELKESDSRRQRKKAEEALRESEEKYRWVLDNMVDVITIIDMNLRFTYVSPSIIRMRGYTAEEAVAQTLEQVMTPESLQISAKVFEEEMKLEASGTADPDRIRIVVVEEYKKDGSIVLMENHLSFMRDEAKQPVGIISVSHDITERKRAEQQLTDLHRRHEQVLDAAAEGILGLDSNGVHTFVNPAAATMLGYKVEELLGRPSHSLWHHTRADGSAYPEEQCEVYACLRQGGAMRAHIDLFWRKDGTSFPVEFSCTPIVQDGVPVATVVTFSDVTERKRAAEELQRTLERLKKSINTTIQVMVSAIEVRDPYTSGHQLRSANLARNIATEMELPPNIIDGVRMAGSIHDIGKISIPAEILSKPGKLSAIEFSLIKEHAQKGYEMLKDVESPWPLAQIVYQHHERMDGSGYPRNLKGDEILMEARIMAVADVVESMASHRPYRPALGINAALEEIEKNKRILYDIDVADACLRLFREKGFKLEGT